jgi:lysophospholipase L1-like esterase
MTHPRYIYLLFILLIPAWTRAKEGTTITRENRDLCDSLKRLYPFLALPANRITGDTGALQEFYKKLDRIKNGSHEQAVVVHIGDSHVQPGIITLPLRKWLQADFGNAGQGMIFPYRVAKSNGPAGYISHADTPWVYCRNVNENRPLPTGIAGFSLRSETPSASFTITFTSPQWLPGDTARLILFHEERDSCFHFTVTNEMNGRVYQAVDSSQAYTTTFLLEDQPQMIRIRAIRSRDTQIAATFYGMSLETNSPGVIVHTIGVNGAMFANYLESQHFIEQLAMLHPDLLIFSLGTNESFDAKGYSSDAFRTDLDSLFLRIRQTGTTPAVILTTPPGIYKSYRKKRRTYYKPNPVTETLSEFLKQYAVSNGMAVWDWYTIMGGKEGMSKWKAKKMTDRRYIHFTPKGYEIEGFLLREAIRDSFEGFNSIGMPKAGTGNKP